MFQEYTLGRNYHKDSPRGQGSIIQRIQRDFPEANKGLGDVDIVSEEFLRFKAELLPHIVEGKQTWTIRYKPNTVRWPYNAGSSKKNRVAVFFPDPSGEWVEFGSITIPRMAVGHVRDWLARHESVAGSGWESRRHMVEGISDIYEPIYGKRLSPSDILVAYALRDFQFKHPQQAVEYRRLFSNHFPDK